MTSDLRGRAVFAWLISAVMVLTMTAAPALAGTTSGQVVLQGQVTSPSGQPVAGAQVQLYAWPSQSFLDTQVTQPGQQVPMSLVGHAASTSSGQYDISIASPGSLQSSASPAGIVNFMAVVLGASTAAGSFYFPLRLGNASGQSVLTSVNGTGNTPAAPVAANLQTSQTTASPYMGCYEQTTFDHDGNKDWATIGSAYMRYAGVNASFTYDSNQTTTLGIGISYTSPEGGFTGNGTFTWTATHGISGDFYDTIGPSAHHYQSQWVPGVWKNVMSGPTCNTKTWYTVSPHHWQGNGGITSNVAIPFAGYCSDMSGLKSWSIYWSTSDTFSGGIGWAMPEIGFNANAQTGWGTSNKLTYYPPVRQPWHLCGENTRISESPGKVVAGVPG